MRARSAGYTLIELIVYMGLAGIGVSAGLAIHGADRLTTRKQQTAFRESCAVAETLYVLADDLRNAERVVPRRRGPGALVFLKDGPVAVWFDRPAEPGVLYRRIVRGDAAERPEVIARGVTDVEVRADGKLFTVRARAGGADRSIVVRRRP